MEDIDLYRTASLMMKEYGDNAAIEASLKSDAMLDNGDLDGARVWRKISGIIAALEDQKTDLLTEH